MSYLVFIIVIALLLSLSILSLCLLLRVEDLETELDETKSLVRASRKSLANAEDRILQRNDLLGYQEERYNKLKNKLTVLEAYITSNNYGNAEIRLQKLKELARPGNQN